MGGDPQIVAAPVGLATEEIGFHVDVAIAEQDEVEPWLRVADILNLLRGFDAPIVPGSFL